MLQHLGQFLICLHWFSGCFVLLAFPVQSPGYLLRLGILSTKPSNMLPWPSKYLYDNDKYILPVKTWRTMLSRSQCMGIRTLCHKIARHREDCFKFTIEGDIDTKEYCYVFSSFSFRKFFFCPSVLSWCWSGERWRGWWLTSSILLYSALVMFKKRGGRVS